MFGDMRELFQMLDNSGPIARTAPAPYPIVDCEKMSAQGLTCNSVIQSSMEPAGNNQCGTWTGVEFQLSVKTSIELVVTGEEGSAGEIQSGSRINEL